MRDVIPDLRRTHFPPSAQAWSHHYSTDSRENTGTYCMWAVASCQGKCNMHQTKSNLSPVDWCVCVCVYEFQTDFDCVFVCTVCVDAAERQKEESLSGIAWRWAGTPSDKHTSLQAYLPD